MTKQHVDYLVDRLRKIERDKRRILLERRKAMTNQHVDYLDDRLRKCEQDKRRYLLQINAAKMTDKEQP
jgi:vacuolar-type H+-ATPase subunit E/Vma4